MATNIVRRKDRANVEDIEALINNFSAIALSGYDRSKELKDKLEQFRKELALSEKGSASDEPQRWQFLQKDVADMMYEATDYVCKPIILPVVPLSQIMMIRLRNLASYAWYDVMLSRIRWLVFAGKLGSPEAAYDLCLIYANASGTTEKARDFVEAEGWFRRFCEIGDETKARELETILHKAKTSCTIGDKVLDTVIRWTGWRKYTP